MLLFLSRVSARHAPFGLFSMTNVCALVFRVAKHLAPRKVPVGLQIVSHKTEVKNCSYSFGFILLVLPND